MIKTLKTVALVIGIFATTATFAASKESVTPLTSISDALQARTAAIQKPKVGSLAPAVSSDTYIVAINYTDDTIFVSFPSSREQLTTHTASRYERLNYNGTSYIEIANPNGVRVWSGYVGYHDLISVYVSNGKYVVYDTK